MAVHASAHSMLLPTPEMKPSGLSDACASDPPIWMGGGFALAFLPSDIPGTVQVYFTSARTAYTRSSLMIRRAFKIFSASILITIWAVNIIYYENVWV